MNVPEAHEENAGDRARRGSDQAGLEDIKATLHMLFDLLEMYGPSWYKRSQHDQIVSAIQKLDALGAPPGPPSK